ncbi:hypothetical protein L207DRAFT_640323 [Hyaloscypha variabilis F]|uniref:Uncharacterized protein n=1 Tax=Hyaloscypha variabilis (strain UAMH 11265 / GT02V1 / F) TaxID=1149755 RepID=A0A2J6R0F2_HYAVF|nr:hypothetical protein L207DRAFT_640323 [Hyaloscypha variabilis F]
MPPPLVASSSTVDLENDKDDVLLSIYDILSELKAFSEIGSFFSDLSTKYKATSKMADVKKHSSDLLNYITSKKDGDPVYAWVPKAPADLGYHWERMIEEVEEDVIAMRGYLRGLPPNYHVEHIRSFRNRVRDLLKLATATRPIDLSPPPTKIVSGHNPYQSPYQPPPSTTKPAPSIMLFNDDELRFYYEDIPVPETDEQRDFAKREYQVDRAAKDSNRIKRKDDEKQKWSKAARDPTGSRVSMSRDSLNNVAERSAPPKTKTLRHPPATTPTAPLATKRKVKELNSPSTLALPQRLHNSPSASPATPKNSTEAGQATKKPRPATPKQFSSNTWNKSVSAIGLSGVVWNNEGQGQNQTKSC